MSQTGVVSYVGASHGMRIVGASPTISTSASFSSSLVGTPLGSSFAGCGDTSGESRYRPAATSAKRFGTSAPLAPERILSVESLSGVGSSSSAPSSASWRSSYPQRTLPARPIGEGRQQLSSSGSSPSFPSQLSKCNAASSQPPVNPSLGAASRGAVTLPSRSPALVESAVTDKQHTEELNRLDGAPDQSTSRQAPVDQGSRHMPSAVPPTKSSASSQGSRSALKHKASADPQLLILRASYLSGLKAPGWFERPTQYQLSVHVGDEARGDPPKKPGRFTTGSVPAAAPRMVAPEEMELRQRIANAVGSMMTGDGELAGGHECRFNSWITVRLSEAGPGPAAGGPAYFRVDVWADKTSLFGQVEQMFFGRVFVPLHNPDWQRRPCTWPVVNAEGKDLAYLTCEFAFAHAPDAVRHLQVDSSSSSEVSLFWRPPRVRDEVVPIVGYQVEVLALHRGQTSSSTLPTTDAEAGSRSGKLSPPGKAQDKESWQHVAEVEASSEPGVVARHLKGDTRYRFRVSAVNEAGVGDIAEVEAVTGPSAPGMCGAPRLAACNQSVLTIEWTAPADNGGSPIVSYWLWVRPFSSMCAVDSVSNFEGGHIKHAEGESTQRADIHTDELNPSVGRYLCSVAALNAAGEVGPPTPDVNSLPFPNPCAICDPSGQTLGPLSSEFRPMSNSQASTYGLPAFHDYYLGTDNVGVLDMKGIQKDGDYSDYYLDSPPPPPPRPRAPQVTCGTTTIPHGFSYNMPDYDVAVPRGAPAHEAELAYARPQRGAPAYQSDCEGMRDLDELG